MTQLTTQKNEQGTGMDFEDLLQFYLDTVCAARQWPVAHVYFPDQNGGDVLFPAPIWHLDDPVRYELFRQVSNDLRFTKGVGLPGRVFAAKEPEWIADVREMPSYERGRLVKDSGLASVLAFPIIHKREVVAVLEFFSDHPFEPDDDILTSLHEANDELSLAYEGSVPFKINKK